MKLEKHNGSVCQKGNKMSLDKKIKDKVVSAYIPVSEYAIYAGFTQKQNGRLRESIENFKAPRSQVNHCTEFGQRGLKPQEEYADVPFRMEKYDSEGTVATAGSAIIIAKFLEQMYRCKVTASIEELAELAVEKGYRGYKREPDGKYISKGCKHIFWERFVSSLYGLETKRALSIRDMLNGLWEHKLSVILLSEKEVEAGDNKKEDGESESRFVLLTGYDPKGITFFDPLVCMSVHKEYSEFLPFIRSAWIISEEDEY